MRVPDKNKEAFYDRQQEQIYYWEYMLHWYAVEAEELSPEIAGHVFDAHKALHIAREELRKMATDDLGIEQTKTHFNLTRWQSAKREGW